MLYSAPVLQILSTDTVAHKYYKCINSLYLVHQCHKYKLYNMYKLQDSKSTQSISGLLQYISKSTVKVSEQ